MRKFIFLSAVLVVAATACGGGGGSNPAPAPPTPTPTAPTQTLTSGGTIPTTGQPTTVGTSGYSVLITLPTIVAGAPASGSVFYSTNNSFQGLAGAPPDAPALPTTFGTALLYTDIRVSSSTANGITLSTQPTFKFTVPAASGAYGLVEYDPTQANPHYTIVGRVAGPSGTTVTFVPPAPPIQTVYTLNQNYTYVLYR